MSEISIVKGKKSTPLMFKSTQKNSLICEIYRIKIFLHVAFNHIILLLGQ